MFFNAHSEEIIGYKQLTDADLGWSSSSHQTHIGLFGDTLTFLYDQQVEEEVMLIFDGNIDMIDCYFDRIETPNGSFRSPKIRKGGRGSVSLVNVIRDQASALPHDCRWYLMWFGLESGTVVFYLFNDRMSDYGIISRYINLSRQFPKGRIISSDTIFNELITYLKDIVNSNSSGILEQLEIQSQIGRIRTFRPFDIEKANQRFIKTGQAGEELVAAYLDRLKSNSQIVNYNWINKSVETGLPYDFTIQELNQTVVYVDVKSTLYKFEQPMVFSGQEMKFIATTPNYQIFRVYDMGEDEKHMRVCDDGITYAPFINSCIDEFSNNISQKKAGIQSVKLLVPTTSEYLIFKPEIRIG